jgi:photosystem II stability/assembly factor-like uncharacterized protein
MNSVLLLAGTEKGLFTLKSDSERNNWSIEGPHLKGWKIFDCQLDRRTDPTLYAAVGHFIYGPCIHISRDFGKTWNQVENGPQYSKSSQFKLNSIWTIVPGSEKHPNRLYAGVDEAGLFVSDDKGFSWHELTGLSGHETRSEWMPGAGGLCCHSVLIDSENPERIWVGISSVGVFRSDDGGSTWEPKNVGIEQIIPNEHFKDIGFCVHSIATDSKDPNKLYQQNHRGVYRSSNGGDSWERIENGLPGSFGFPIGIHPHKPDTLFTVPLESDEYRMPPNGELKVYKTENNGDSWAPFSKGLPANCFASVMRQALAIDNLDPCGIYFGTTGGQVFSSNDEGSTWNQLPCQLPRINSLSVVSL